jgi:hypothetical protein
MKAICTKTFSDFIENATYILIEYDDKSMFYAGLAKEKGPIALFPVSKKYRKFFITIKEQRKLKLQKINEK